MTDVTVLTPLPRDKTAVLMTGGARVRGWQRARSARVVRALAQFQPTLHVGDFADAALHVIYTIPSAADLWRLARIQAEPLGETAQVLSEIEQRFR
jgi:hypothetical protein